MDEPNVRRHACQLAHRDGRPYIDPFGRILLGDFWEWALSDVLSDALRDRFAAFLVARLTGSLGAPSGDEPRVRLADGQRFAVCSARASDGASFRWSPADDISGVAAALFLDDDPMNLAGWRFYVFAPRASGCATPDALERDGVLPLDATELPDAVRTLCAKG